MTDDNTPLIQRDIIKCWQSEQQEIRSENKEIFGTLKEYNAKLDGLDKRMEIMESFKTDTISRIGEFDHLHTRVDNHRIEFKRDISDLTDLIKQYHKDSSTEYENIIKKFNDFSQSITDNFSTIKSERDQLAGAWIFMKFIGGGSVILGVAYAIVKFLSGGTI